MSNDIINTIYLALSFLALFGLAEILYHYANVKVELTRKLVHFGTGLLTLLFPVMLNNHWLVLFLCASFALILLVSLRFNLLRSINAIDRVSAGSISYPIAVYVCYLGYDHFNGKYIYFYLPILALAICDPIAALTGKRWPMGKYRIGKDNKTMMGSTMFFISCFLLSLGLLLLMNDQLDLHTLLLSFSIALTCAVAEAISPRGLDNLSIPFTALGIMVIFSKIFI
jgi:dolichol kinase